MMDENNRNFLLALVLSVLVLFGWQAFFSPKTPPVPQTAEQGTQTNPPQPGAPQPGATQPGAAQPVAPSAGTPPAPAFAPIAQSREAVIAASPRVPIDTPSLRGSISLKGARLDDLVLKQFTVTVKPGSENVTLLSPSGSKEPYYAEHGWTAAVSEGVKVPSPDTEWTQETQNPLTADTPVKLVWNNGEGLTFRRTIAVDQDYMFTVTQEVENKSAKPVTLYPYGFISRHGRPHTEGLYILHEGLIGVIGEEGLQEIKYTTAADAPYDTVARANMTSLKGTSGWLGITDKYWATALIPAQNAPYTAAFKVYNAKQPTEQFQTDFVLNPVTIAPGAKQSVTSMLFAGAKQVSAIDGYANKYNIDRFDKMIDWGLFHFITKPLFRALDFFYHLIGNFGIAILIVTILVKLAFFPLANKSYESMSKMKKLQPEMKRLQERFKDDKMKQQQALMELYKKEKVNPMAGCLPILIQIPVFFALYKVLYITIEMRHAPFFGWIQDLSSPDPTTIFNLFGLIPWAPPHFLMIGIWPLIMGVTMFVQMKLNPTPPDPVQQQIFTWMPVLFTFMLAAFPAGLVIYWTWNNTLSIIQQWVIMRRQGVEVNLWENMGLGRKSAGSPGKGGVL
jgi:YidC/Oxa1 family membrane protein insertase